MCIHTNASEGKSTDITTTRQLQYRVITSVTCRVHGCAYFFLDFVILGFFVAVDFRTAADFWMAGGFVETIARARLVGGCCMPVFSSSPPTGKGPWPTTTAEELTAIDIPGRWRFSRVGCFSTNSW